MLRAFTWANEQLVALAGLDPASPDSDMPPLVWIDLISPTSDEDTRVSTLLGIDIPSRAEMEEIELSARLYHEDGAEFATMTALTNLDGDEPLKTPVTFILKGKTLVTVRYAEPRPFLAFITRASRPRVTPCSTGEQIMLGIIEAMIDRDADALERAGNEIDAISADVFRKRADTARKHQQNLSSILLQIGRKENLLTMVQESLVSISRLVTYHTARDAEGSRAGKETRQVVKQIQRDAQSLGDHARALSSKLSFLLDATLGFINLEQNQIIKLFSVAAVVFLPPTLVASIYGMNFHFMPELSWPFGYPLALCLMVLSAVLPYLYIRRRGWL